jgi:hypothetical protein
MSELLSDRYCEGYCYDGGKGKFSDCSGCEIYPLEARITALEGILDAISDMEGQEGMTDAKFARNTLKLINHGVVL